MTEEREEVSGRKEEWVDVDGGRNGSGVRGEEK